MLTRAATRRAWGLLDATAREWREDKIPRLAAALAYYTVLSLAPLLIVTIAVAAAVFDRSAAERELLREIEGVLGHESAVAVGQLIDNTAKPASSALAAGIGFLTILLGSSGVFGQLQDALNTIWEVQPRPGRKLRTILRDRFFSFSMVLVTGFLLLVSLVLSTVLSSFGIVLGDDGTGSRALWRLFDLVTSVGVITVLFAMIFKFLPDVSIRWSDVWPGAVLTSILFTVGKSLIGLYLGQSAIGSTYGAAGSLVIILVWVYYSAQIVLTGAEFTQVYARSRGTWIIPAENAVRLDAAARAQQGIPRRASS